MATATPYAGPLTLPYGAFTKSLPFPTVPLSNAEPPPFLLSGFGPLFCYDSVLPNGVIGIGYSQTLTAGGGSPPYTFAVTAGALPGGLTLNTTTGVISGTPTAVATSTFSVTVTDARPASTTQSFTIITTPVPSSNSGYIS